MEIARERFLDDSRTYHLTVGLRSRTTAAHSLLSELTDDERAQVSAAIVHALDEVERILRSKMATATK
jgi:peptidyl-tRNA hydrolase